MYITHPSLAHLLPISSVNVSLVFNDEFVYFLYRDGQEVKIKTKYFSYLNGMLKVNS
jgi:hypothetical protein